MLLGKEFDNCVNAYLKIIKEDTEDTLTFGSQYDCQIVKQYQQSGYNVQIFKCENSNGDICFRAVVNDLEEKIYDSFEDHIKFADIEEAQMTVQEVINQDISQKESEDRGY